MKPLHYKCSFRETSLKIKKSYFNLYTFPVQNKGTIIQTNSKKETKNKQGDVDKIT